eukprot:scaffold125461_cov66-Phaeocystis_antarctica.AAC.3
MRPPPGLGAAHPQCVLLQWLACVSYSGRASETEGSGSSLPAHRLRALPERSTGSHRRRPFVLPVAWSQPSRGTHLGECTRRPYERALPARAGVQQTEALLAPVSSAAAAPSSGVSGTAALVTRARICRGATRVLADAASHWPRLWSPRNGQVVSEGTRCGCAGTRSHRGAWRPVGAGAASRAACRKWVRLRGCYVAGALSACQTTRPSNGATAADRARQQQGRCSQCRLCRAMVARQRSRTGRHARTLRAAPIAATLG